MKLDDFANNFSNVSGKVWDSPKFENVNSALGGFEKANPMLITSTWQTLLESPDLLNKLYPAAVKKISGDPSLSLHLEKYLLCLGDNKYCLLIFDPTFTSDEPIYFDASKNNSLKSITSGFGIWRSKMNNSLAYRNNYVSVHATKSIFPTMHSRDSFSSFDTGIYNENILNTIQPEILKYGIVNIEWPMIVCKTPKKILNCLHPKKPHKVILKEGELFRSLAGIYTKNNQGVFGVTICLHCFPNSYVEVGKTKVIINGINGIVISVHNVSDSCFVQLEATESQINDLITASGPLQGTTPREFEKCYFTNKDGDEIQTNVIGWSPDILYFDPYNQVKVLTNPITNPGDSGSALMDLSGNVLGFSFFRTEINAVKEFSAWIWAASVFKAHNLIF